MFSALLALAVFSANLVAGQDSSNTATVSLGSLHGKAEHLASGFIYGIPDSGFSGMDQDQIPDMYYSEMGFRYGRAGGAQLDAGGWVDGLDAYKARFNSTLQNYNKCREFGARFQILPHDLWGTDHSNYSAYWPGDNGDWTPYDNFLTQLMSDIVANDMLKGLDWDLWNEPDGGLFWLRSQEQYLAMWKRTYHIIRKNQQFKKVLIVGPSSAYQPGVGNSWWVGFVQFVVKNKVIPNQYTWHDEAGDPQADYYNLQAVLEQYKAPARPINVNEYAVFGQQNPSTIVWYISRLERFNMFGLRGNWLSTCQLHDYMASLLWKTDSSTCGNSTYFPNGEWQVYKYYSQNMTGNRITTASSGDNVIDVFATVEKNTVRALAGVQYTGVRYVAFNNLTAVGLPSSGTVNIQSYAFDWAGHNTAVGAPTDLGLTPYNYTDNSVTVTLNITSDNEFVAYSYEFATES